jgi:hypothetical protein
VRGALGQGTETGQSAGHGYSDYALMTIQTAERAAELWPGNERIRKEFATPVALWHYVTALRSGRAQNRLVLKRGEAG